VTGSFMVRSMMPRSPVPTLDNGIYWIFRSLKFPVTLTGTATSEPPLSALRSGSF